jgi:phenylalanyl-tRNA synthetase alpha chain
MSEDLTAQVLSALSSADGPILTSETFPNASDVAIQASVTRLESVKFIKSQKLDREEVILTEEGETIAENGSHEARVFEAVRSAMEGLAIKDLPGIVGKVPAQVGQGTAFKNKWIKKDKDMLRTSVDSIKDVVREQLQTIKETKTYEDKKVVADLKKRQLVTVRKVYQFRIERGPEFATEFVKQETDLTADMIASGAWKTVKLKPYNFNAKGAITPAGALHPLNKVRSEFREIFFEMGFEEMPTNRYVETGFWNFDALFVPQQHPARDVQDTFFISDPPKADPPRADPPTSIVSSSALPMSTSHKRSKSKIKTLDYKKYWENIRAVHQDGKYGSIGYRYPWSADESLKLVLRTHTTAISAYMLQKLALDPRPARYFSIDRVFRNETVDQTHLAEFHQVEGVIADFGLTLGGLIGFMEVFFGKMGIKNLKFKPAYNPYTEPSLEIFSYHEGLKKWVEIGNSGMFRPEMLEPMGLPTNLRVYGWGLSLERPTMIK